MHRTIFILFAFLLPVMVMGQEIEMDVTVPDSPPEDRFGPNRLHFVNAFVVGGGTLGIASTDLASQITGSSVFGLGAQYKLKLCTHFDLGADFAFERYSLGVSQEEGKYFPDSIRITSQMLVKYSVPVSMFLRVNFGRRGDFIAWHVDAGGYSDFGLSDKNVKWEYTEDGSSKKTIQKSPNLIAGSNQGVFVRLGYNRFSIGLRYRLTDLVDPTKFDSDLSPYEFVARIGLHK